MSVDWKSPKEPPKAWRASNMYSSPVLVWAYNREDGNCTVFEALYCPRSDTWTRPHGVGMGQYEILNWCEMPAPPNSKDKKVASLARAMARLGIAFMDKFELVLGDPEIPEITFSQSGDLFDAAQEVKRLMADKSVTEAYK